MHTRFLLALLVLISFLGGVHAGCLQEGVGILAYTVGVRRDQRIGAALPTGSAVPLVADVLICIVISPKEFSGTGIEVYSWHPCGEIAVWPVAVRDAYVSFDLPAEVIRGVESLLRPIELRDLHDLKELAEPPAIGGVDETPALDSAVVSTNIKARWPYLRYCNVAIVVDDVLLGVKYDSKGIITVGDESLVSIVAPTGIAGQKLRVLLSDCGESGGADDARVFRNIGNKVSFLVSDDVFRELTEGIGFIAAREMLLIGTAGSSSGTIRSLCAGPN